MSNLELSLRPTDARPLRRVCVLGEAGGMLMVCDLDHRRRAASAPYPIPLHNITTVEVIR